MNQQNKEHQIPFTVLMAEDDPDDRFLLEQAFRDLESKGEVRFVEDGEQLMDYLLRQEKYAHSELCPRPTLILLDLNMPKKDGRQALREIKSEPALAKIPVVVWTTSDLEEDMAYCRKAGADSYITKPTGYSELVEALRDIGRRYLSLPS
jgi:two-component system, response regulator